MKPYYRQDNKHFAYYNQNPKNRKTAGDCVIRAISYALQKSWDEVFKDLCELGFKEKRMPNDDAVYQKYLEQLGYPKQAQPRKADNTKFTIVEFANKQHKGTYIIRTANHLTVVQDGKIIDTWDCGAICVGNYWRVN